MNTRLSTIDRIDVIDTLSKAQIIRDLNEWFYAYEGLPVTLTRKATQMSIESLKQAWRFAWYVTNWHYIDRPTCSAKDEKQYDIREIYSALQCGYYEKYSQ